MKDSVMSAIIVVFLWAALPFLGVSRASARKVSPPQALCAPSAMQSPFSVRAAELASSTEQAVAAFADEAELHSTQADFDSRFRLPILRDEATASMDLHTYLTGVLLAEMPLSFADEALKAQAVASRTYALRSYAHRRHDPVALCSSAGCCQGWVDPETVSPSARARAEEAVRATDGLVIRYQGALIDATFFSCSGGQTESAAAVWGNELPYLQSVESPGEEGAAHYEDQTQIPLAAFQQALTEADPAVCFPEALGGWVGQIRYTPGGGVDEIELGGRPFSGAWLRKRFQLRSTAFSLELTDTEAIFSTKGFGHRVGLSQYGADAMARSGNSFMEILSWYYQGVTVEAAE